MIGIREAHKITIQTHAIFPMYTISKWQTQLHSDIAYTATLMRTVMMQYILWKSSQLNIPLHFSWLETVA